jgi:hypothetical protein
MASPASPPSASSAVLPNPASLRGQTMSRSERRRINRQACDLSSNCVLISLVEPVLLPVRIRNLSQQGLGLLTTMRVAPGSFLAVKVHGRRLKAPRIMKARVIHATFLQDIRTWLIGCCFVEGLRKEDLALIC